MNCTRHHFPTQVVQELKKLYKLDNWHAVAAVIEDAAVIAGAIALPYLAQPHVPWWVSYLTVSVPVIGCRQRALATLLHESAHKTLARNAVWNYVAGSFFSGYLIFQSWHAYHDSHVVGHHGRFNDPEHDPDLKYLLGQGVYETQSRLKFVFRYLVAPFFLLKTPGKLVDLIRYRFLSENEPMWERLTKLVYIGLLAAAALHYGIAKEAALFWLVPYLTAFPVINWFIELSEHYPLMGDAKSDLYMSRNRWSGPIAKFFLGIHNENYHQTHHLAPFVPFWKMPEAHRVMLADDQYRAVQTRELGWLVPILHGVPSIINALSYGLASFKGMSSMRNGGK